MWFKLGEKNGLMTDTFFYLMQISRTNSFIGKSFFKRNFQGNRLAGDNFHTVYPGLEAGVGQF